MRLLLDEMHSPSVANELVARGHDVVAIAAGGDLRGRTDAEVLDRAAADERVVVTGNVADFLPIVQRRVGDGRRHPGLVLTSPKRFDRSRSAYPGDLVNALDAFLTDRPIAGDSWIWWLEPT